MDGLIVPKPGGSEDEVAKVLRNRVIYHPYPQSEGGDPLPVGPRGSGVQTSADGRTAVEFMRGPRYGGGPISPRLDPGSSASLAPPILQSVGPRVAHTYTGGGDDGRHRMEGTAAYYKEKLEEEQRECVRAKMELERIRQWARSAEPYLPWAEGGRKDRSWGGDGPKERSEPRMGPVDPPSQPSRQVVQPWHPLPGEESSYDRFGPEDQIPELRRFQVPHRFEGNGAQDWIEDMEEWLEYKRALPRARYEAGIIMLSDGCRRKWRRQRADSPSTWEALKIFLLRWYGSKSEQQVRNQLAAIKWKNSVVQLGQEIMDVPDTERYITTAQLVGIYLEKLPPDLMQEGWKDDTELLTLNEVVNQYQRCETSLTARTSLILSSRAYGESGKNESRNRPKEEGQGSKGGKHPGHTRIQTAPKGGLTFEQAQGIRCSECTGWGHERNNCPNRNSELYKAGMACHRCKGTGHMRRSCSSPAGPNEYRPNNPGNTKVGEPPGTAPKTPGRSGGQGHKSGN